MGLKPLRIFPLGAGLCLLALGLHGQTPEQTTPAPAAATTNPQSANPVQGPQTAPQTPTAPNQPVKNPDGTYTIRSTARLVVLDVVVSDRNGNVVTDLTRDQFHVTEAGDPETVLNFEPAGAHALTPDVTIDSTKDLDRLAPRAPVNIILLDEFNTRFEDMAFARYSLEKWLKRQPDKLDTPTMLLAVNLQKFDVVKDYTQDKRGLMEALDHYFNVYPWQAQSVQWVGERYALAFVTLQRVAEAVMGHDGHKNMIWIGRGFPAQNAVDTIDNEDLINTAAQLTVNRLRDARVTLYTIDPAGLQVRDTYGATADFNDPFGGNYQFSKLATATGGKAMYGRNDVDAEIGRSIREGSSFYTLTYRPVNDSRDPSKFRKIVVTVDRPGATVTTREGYFLSGGPGRMDPKAPPRRLAIDLMAAESSNMIYDGLPMTVMATSTPDKYLIHVDQKAVGWSAATETERRHTELILMVTQFDKKGKALKRDAHIIKLTPSIQVPPTGRIEVPVNFPYQLEPEPKAVRARVVVRMSGRIGTADLDLKARVPAA